MLPLPPNRRRLPLPKSLTTTRDVILHSSEEDLYIKSNLKSQPSVRGPSKEQPVNRIPLVNSQKSDGFDVLIAYLEQRMRQKEEERLERERQQELGDVSADADIEDEDDEEEEEVEEKEEEEERRRKEEEGRRRRRRRRRRTPTTILFLRSQLTEPSGTGTKKKR